MNLLRTAAILMAILTILGAGSAVLAAEQWATDPATGAKVGIMLADDGTLVSVSWSGPTAGGLAEGQGKLQFVFKSKDGQETKAQAVAEMKAGKLNGKATVKWSTGDSYDGYCQDGLLNGLGIYRLADGSTYQGEFVNGRYEGRGTFTFSDGQMYDGDWKNGVYEGRGTYKWPSGITYEGEFSRGHKEGRGGQKWPDGAAYDGDWKNDKRDGKGIHKNPNGDIYDGDWKNDAPNGFGTIKRANGDTYQGGIKDGSHNGQGTYRWSTGETYEGEWKNGLRDGQGVSKLPNGEIYEGEYKNNYREGRGVYTWPNGNVYRGEFKNGVREGQGSMKDADGKVIYEGLWKNDQRAGAASGGGSPDSGATGSAKADKVLGIPWGASESDARRIMKERPGTEYWFTNKEGAANVQSYIGPFNNEKAGIHVYFYQDKMFQVIISHVVSADRLPDKFNELKNGMTQRYGTPSSETGQYLDAKAFWELGGGYKAGLRIRKNPYNQPDRPFEIQLSYWHLATYLVVHPEEKPGAGPGKDF